MNFSGFGINKVFKTGVDPKKPYYYISASLDLTGAVQGGTYYFNTDNNFNYSNVRDYSNFITIDENCVIAEVCVYSDPEIVISSDAEDAGYEPYFAIGGSKGPVEGPQDPVQVWWAAPAPSGSWSPPYTIDSGDPNPFYNGFPLSIDEVNQGPVNYFGHEGGHFPYYQNHAWEEDLYKKYKYLAVTIMDGAPSVPERLALTTASTEEKAEVPATAPTAAPAKELVKPSISQILKREKEIVNGRQRKRMFRGLPPGDEAIASGKLNVVLKVYPKAQ